MREKFEYKYRIKDKLNELNHSDYLIAIKSLPKALKITSRTFYRYMNTKISEEYSMPVDHIARLTKYFNCKIEEMLNYEPPPLATEGFKVRDKSDLLKKFKLVK
jgi:predicted DNA-binding transcriptional regulator AlpA